MFSGTNGEGVVSARVVDVFLPPGAPRNLKPGAREAPGEDDALS